jgi:hypothetical protein
MCTPYLQLINCKSNGNILGKAHNQGDFRNLKIIFECSKIAQNIAQNTNCSKSNGNILGIISLGKTMYLLSFGFITINVVYVKSRSDGPKHSAKSSFLRMILQIFTITTRIQANIQLFVVAIKV